MLPSRALGAFSLAAALGAVSAFGFAPFDLWPVTIACLGLLLAMIAASGRVMRTFGLGWWFALGHFCVGLNWIATAFTFQAAMPAWLGWVAVVLLSLYLALYPALGLAVGWAAAKLAGGMRPLPLFAGAGWIASEWLRATAFTGFAWNPLGAIWMAVPGAPVLAPVIGTYAMSGLTVVLAGAGAAAFRPKMRRAAATALAPLLIAIGAALFWHVVRSAASPPGPAIVRSSTECTSSFGRPVR